WDALFAWLEARDLSSFFGLRPGRSETRPGPSAVRRGMRYVGAALREVGILVMFAGAINQAAVELWAIRDRWRIPQPEPLALLAHKMRFLQGWFMFSPNPVSDDGTIVVDAITVDGRHIDPFTLKEPLFDISGVKSFGYNQIWCDYFNRMHLGGNAGYRDPMRGYLLRLPQRTRNANGALVSGDVYWVEDINPKWNETAPTKPERLKLFSFDNPALKPAMGQVQGAVPPTPPPAPAPVEPRIAPLSASASPRLAPLAASASPRLAPPAAHP